LPIKWFAKAAYFGSISTTDNAAMVLAGAAFACAPLN